MKETGSYDLYINIVADRNIYHRSITQTFDSTARCTADGTLAASLRGTLQLVTSGQDPVN